MNTITNQEMLELCKAGQGAECCRYIASEAKGMVCLKHTSLRARIDARVAAEDFKARGDNCPGKLCEEGPLEILIEHGDTIVAKADPPYTDGGVMKWIVIAVALTVSNYLWQAVTGHNWNVAFDRSYFQAVAVFVTYLNALAWS